MIRARASCRTFVWPEYDAESRHVVIGLREGTLNHGGFDLLGEFCCELTEWGESHFDQADFRSYADVHQRAVDVEQERMTWARKAAVNVARMRQFSSHRSIRGYAPQIWAKQSVSGNDAK